MCKPGCSSNYGGFANDNQQQIMAPYRDNELMERTDAFERHDSKTSNQSFLVELFQSQLALWTCAFSTVGTYLWQSRTRFCMVNFLVVVPLALFITACLSWALFIFIAVGHLFFTSAGDGDTISSWVVKKIPQSSTNSEKSSAKNGGSSLKRRKSVALKTRKERSHSFNSAQRLAALRKIADEEKNRPTKSAEIPAGFYFWLQKPGLEKLHFTNNSNPELHARG